MFDFETKLDLIGQKWPIKRFNAISCTWPSQKWWTNGSDAGDFCKYLITGVCALTSLRHGEEEKDRGNGGNGRPRRKRDERKQNLEELPVSQFKPFSNYYLDNISKCWFLLKIMIFYYRFRLRPFLKIDHTFQTAHSASSLHSWQLYTKPALFE